MEPPMALGRVLPRLVALRYCGEVSMGAGHMIYGESSHGEDHMISEGCPMGEDVEEMDKLIAE